MRMGMGMGRIGSEREGGRGEKGKGGDEDGWMA